MTFPDIPLGTVESAVKILAGPNASRAALHTAGLHVRQSITALQQANEESANCDVCGHFHALTEHPANAHSYNATAKLERESGGDKAATWDGVTHDHAMCDPDRLCGRDSEPDEYPIRIAGNRAGKTAEAARAIQEHVDQETVRIVQARRQAGPKLASFFKDTSPAAAAEQAAMQRLGQASQRAQRDTPTRWTDADAAQLREDLRTPALFPGGRMWSQAQEDAGLQRLMADIEGPVIVDARKLADHTMDSFRYPPEGATDGPVPPADDECCDTAGAVLDAVGMAPAYATPENLGDKLRILADVVNAQAPLGSDLANFRRRLLAILDMN